jgi:hypothetical protein
MGIGDWDEHVHFDWRRIHDNIDWLRPETIRWDNCTLVYLLMLTRGQSEILVLGLCGSCYIRLLLLTLQGYQHCLDAFL